MDKNIILQYKSSFDSIVQYIESDDTKEQVEVWFARELQTVLGYARWENYTSSTGIFINSFRHSE